MNTDNYIKSAGSDHLRKFGQYFTPPQIAKFMLEWVAPKSNIRILDPAIGNSIFPETAISLGKDLTFNGYEVDPLILSSFPPLNNTNIYLEDFLLSNWEDTYDGIIANPPYLKFQYLLNREEIQKSFKLKSNVVPNRLANSYIWFIIKSIQQLRPNGRMAFIVPPDFLDSASGKVVRDYFLESKYLETIVSFTYFDDPIFPSALTDACILLISKKENDFLNILFPKSLNDLDFHKFLNDQGFNKSINYKQLGSHQKWGFLIRDEPVEIDHQEKLTNLSEFCNVRRGLATGANKYFLLNRDEVDALNLEDSDYVKVIPKSSPIIKGAFTSETFRDLSQRKQKVYLFCPENEASEPARQYIIEGLEQGINNLSLPSKRKPWYSRENVAPAPILVGQANRSCVKVVRNFQSDVVHLTAFHGVYPVGLWNNYTDAIYAILRSNFGQELLKNSSKKMATGLLKFQPKDLQSASFIKLDQIGNFLDYLNTLGYELALSKENEERILDKINILITDLFLNRS